MDDGFGYWMAGLIDGEGCFSTTRNYAGGNVCTRFALRLREDDRETIFALHAETGLGHVHRICPRNPAANPCWSWEVGNRADCEALVRLLERYPLRTKKATHFAVWKELVALRGSTPGRPWHGASKDNMLALKERLHAVKRYEVPA